MTTAAVWSLGQLQAAKLRKAAERLGDSNLIPHGREDDLIFRMTAVWLRNITAAILQSRRSSSHPRGVRLESPNLSAVFPNVVTYGGSRPHIAPVVMIVYMPCSS